MWLTVLTYDAFTTDGKRRSVICKKQNPVQQTWINPAALSGDTLEMGEL